MHGTGNWIAVNTSNEYNVHLVHGTKQKHNFFLKHIEHNGF